MNLRTPKGMNRRHFMSHLAGASALAASAYTLTRTVEANAKEMVKKQKAAILLWMGGGPSSIDIWDLKPGSANGGPFKPIATNGDMQICEHMPLMAQQMDKMSLVRSMSTREADHMRGRYYMHTGFTPNPNVTHPSYGSVVAHELGADRPNLDIPAFVSVGGASEGPGFLGMAYSPFSVDANGRVRNLDMGIPVNRMNQRTLALQMMEEKFIKQKRGAAALEHAKVIDKTLALMTSQQMQAFRVETEDAKVRERYGENNFGRGCLLARRLVEAGVPFVEVNLGGWDNHQNIFDTLQNQRLPQLDQGMSALIDDLSIRGMLDSTAIIWMGEFGRTPRINGNTGRDHWARSWSVAVGGAGMKPGIAVGQTNEDGSKVEGSSYTSQDLMATVCKSLDIDLSKTFMSGNGRPMKIANGGKIIKELI
ncbi:DUF1501 domain-containing protein [Mariniblastus fucicola]|uniref:DUF1501 domain-containing protein n=1 Tax=Mariniblastus fucicola TaxID=980251 RepID=A0A5B9PA54_9BACT|nr:DUF1501 domain-containing protein [Mariniblastus fucicola]QEG21386.1 hypothetical protein MFFC18_12420 [Mariniblastus fucicola]